MTTPVPDEFYASFLELKAMVDAGASERDVEERAIELGRQFWACREGDIAEGMARILTDVETGDGPQEKENDR